MITLYLRRYEAQIFNKEFQLSYKRLVNGREMQDNTTKEELHKT